MIKQLKNKYKKICNKFKKISFDKMRYRKYIKSLPNVNTNGQVILRKL